LAFGEIFATAITLILIPVLIAISTDVKAGIKSNKTAHSKNLIKKGN
jgi:hypothetical protein